MSLARIHASTIIEARLEMAVARATPSTDMLQKRTNTRFSATFKRPVRVRTIRGVLVSPLALKMEIRKFVIEMKGTPRK